MVLISLPAVDIAILMIVMEMLILSKASSGLERQQMHISSNILLLRRLRLGCIAKMVEAVLHGLLCSVSIPLLAAHYKITSARSER